MCQEKKEDEDSPALRNALTYQNKDYVKKCNERLITDANNSIDNINIDRKIIKTRKQKGEGKQLYG